MNALDVQVDGDHYKKLRLQPIELAYLVGGTPCFCKLAKYGSREKVDRSIDLKKALHCISLEMQLRIKYPSLFEQNYRAKTDAEMDNAEAWIEIFTQDELLRKALYHMLGGSYAVAEQAVTEMIAAYE